jgi:3-hydroxyacyl-CoA dehydrogenase
MHLAIIGGGKMGTAVFQWAVDRDLSVTLCARNADNLSQQEGRFHRRLERAVRRGEISDEKAAARKAAVRFTTKIAEVAGADFVLESVAEDYQLKKRMLVEIEAAVGPDTLILSNTSSISLALLASLLKRPERFCGLHFFYPVMVISMIEIVTWPGLMPGAVERLQALCTVLGRKGVVVDDVPGSPLNYILLYLYIEGLYLLEEGAALPLKIDTAARRYFSPGPCEAIDSIGVELLVNGLRIFTLGPDAGMEFIDNTTDELPPERAGGRAGFHTPWLFKKLLDEKRLGRKTSRGIFIYEGDRTLDDDPSFYVCPRLVPRPISDEEIGLRLFYAMYNATLHMVKHGHCTADDADEGIREILLMEKGPLHFAKARGFETVRRELENLESKFGRRFRPPMQLEEVSLS